MKHSTVSFISTIGFGIRAYRSIRTVLYLYSGTMHVPFSSLSRPFFSSLYIHHPSHPPHPSHHSEPPATQDSTTPLNNHPRYPFPKFQLPFRFNPHSVLILYLLLARCGGKKMEKNACSLYLVGLGLLSRDGSPPTSWFTCCFWIGRLPHICGGTCAEKGGVCSLANA